MNPQQIEPYAFCPACQQHYMSDVPHARCRAKTIAIPCTCESGGGEHEDWCAVAEVWRAR